MKRAWMISLALALSLGGLTPAHAQIAAAIGKPLPDSRMPKGTVTVLVIAGTTAKPVGGIDVLFDIGDAERTARTNAAGRANMPNVEAGATVRVTVKGSKGDVSSEAFPMPDAGGVHLLLSTEPFTGGGGGGAGAMAGGGGPMAGGGGPMAGGAGGGPMAGGGGRPEPRMMSGRGRPDKGVPGGTDDRHGRPTTASATGPRTSRSSWSATPPTASSRPRSRRPTSPATRRSRASTAAAGPRTT